MAYKTWANNETLYAVDLNGVVANTVPRFASSTERSAYIGTPATGQLTYVTGVGFQYWSGSAWVDLVPLARLLPAGGTTGQVLRKQSNTDYDVGWVTP